MTRAIDADMDGVVDGTENIREQAEAYAEQMATQLRKGYLAYCVLLICADEPRYTSEIISQLHAADLVVVEGTIYPLLSRLQKDKVLQYEWQESEQGPPRKYYSLTDFGKYIVEVMSTDIEGLNKTLQLLQKGAAE